MPTPDCRWALSLFVLLLMACSPAEPTGEGEGGEGSAGAEQADDDLDWDDDEDIEAGTEYTASAIEQLGISPPDQPWAEMSAEEKEFYMIGRVLPIMHEIFARHDPQRYEGFSCESCHGNDMREVNYVMPAGSIFSLPEPGSQAWNVMEATQGEAVRFMQEEVTPTMGTLLGADDYTCFHCHTRR